MDEKMTPQEAEELFVNQAAHLLLALAGVKPLPTLKRDSIQLDEVMPSEKKIKSRPKHASS